MTEFHDFCGRLDCALHGGRARREHELRMEGMRLAVELIMEHARTGASMHPVDEFRDGVETAGRVVEMTIHDLLFVPPAYDECTDTPTLLDQLGEKGITLVGERD